MVSMASERPHLHAPALGGSPPAQTVVEVSSIASEQPHPHAPLRKSVLPTLPPPPPPPSCPPYIQTPHHPLFKRPLPRHTSTPLPGPPPSISDHLLHATSFNGL